MHNDLTFYLTILTGKNCFIQFITRIHLNRSFAASDLCHMFTQSFKATLRENTPSNKTKALTNSMNMSIWEIGTSNQLVSSKSAFFVTRPCCTPLSIFDK